MGGRFSAIFQASVIPWQIRFAFKINNLSRVHELIMRSTLPKVFLLNILAQE